MEQCGPEMSRGNSESGIKYLVAAAHSAEKPITNPFDEQFSYAARNKITRFVTSNTGSSSPLNTPSITLTENGAFIPTLTLDLTTPAISTPFSSIIPDSAIDFLKTPNLSDLKNDHENNNENNNNNNNVMNSSINNNHNIPNINVCLIPEQANIIHNTSNNSSTSLSLPLSHLSVTSCENVNLKQNALSNMIMQPVILAQSHKSPISNAVSVICQSSKTSEIDEHDNNKNSLPLKMSISETNSSSLHQTSNETLKNTYLTAKPFLASNGNSSSNGKSSTLGPLMIALPTSNDASNQSSHSNSSHNSLPGMIKDTSETVTLNVPSIAKKKKNKLLNSSPGSGHRKEKTVEEMLKKIIDTEKSLPPKAKPGRKSKGSVEGEGDQKERKKRSLERNRAAAMRCRLKKKKEVNSLKERCDKYQEENQRLANLVVSLQKEVQSLKVKLLSHECSC